MEGLAVLFGLVLLVVVGVLPIYAAVAVMNLRRRLEADEGRNAQRWTDLTAKLQVLENRWHESQPALARTHEAPRGGAPEALAPTPVKPVVPAAVVPPAPVVSARPPVNVAPPKVAPEPGQEALHAPLPRAETTAPHPPPRIAPAVAPISPVHSPVASPSSAAIPPASSHDAPPRATPLPPSRVPSGQAEKPARGGFEIEEILGTNWLNKIGIGMLVLGLAFLLAQQIRHLGPGGKVLLGLGLSAGMIAVGVRYETNERYRILARAVAAGGWGLLFFLSYAVYHLDATHVIDSRELDFLLMLTVAAAIVWYSLHYRSQSTTALALLLAYLTVGIHHTSVYSLIASVILAATVVWIALRMRWYELEGFAIAATYFNHYLWVTPFIESMGAHRVEFEGFRTSLLLLGFYWLLFRFSYIYRKPNEEQERVSTAAALLNGICLLGLMKYQSVHPEWTFWALMTLGWIELGLAALAATRRRVAFVVLATIGSALLLAAFPFRYAGTDLSWLWLIAAQAFLMAGVFTREIVFRRVGIVTVFVVTAYMILVTAGPLVERLIDSSEAGPFYPAAWLFGAGAMVCYGNAHWVRGRWTELWAREFEQSALAVMTYAGGLLALLSVWFLVPGLWTAVAWAALSLALNFAGERIAQAALRVQGELIALAAIVRLITLNFSAAERWQGMSLRLITVGITALLLYVGAAFSKAAPHDQKQEDELSSMLAIGHTWAASILLYVLAWYELAPMRVAVAWAIGGLVLLEIGLVRKTRSLCWQAYAGLMASFVRICLVNLAEAGTGAGISLRAYTVSTVAGAFYYADWRLRQEPESEWKAPVAQVAPLLPYLGTGTIAALLYFEIWPAWIAAGWSAMSLALMGLAYVLKRKDFLYQSMAMALLVALRAFLWNFSETSDVGTSFLETRPGQTGVAIALLFAALPLAFAWRRLVKDEKVFPLEKRPEQVFFFVPFAVLTALIAVEATSGHLTVAWGAEGVAVFLCALAVGERSFRLAGLGLLLLCVVKIFVLDVWGLDPQSRYITLIVLGVALVLVSFLYTRYKEKFRQYL